jgi:hypothetical protein
VTYSDKNFHRYLYENKQNPQVLTGIVDKNGKRFEVKQSHDLISRSPKSLADAIPLPVPIKVIVTGYGICMAVNCGQLLANAVQTVSDIATKEIEQCQQNKADCNTAKKLLKEVIRLAEKFGINLPDSRKKLLTEKINNGTITSDDLPGSIQNKFPSKFKGKSLSEIEKICK